MRLQKTSYTARFGLFLALFGAAFLTMCNTVDPIEEGWINLNLNDSLTVEAGKFDSLEVDILEETGAMRMPVAFKGEYSRSDEGSIKNIPLGDNPPDNYQIQVRAYKNGELIATYKIVVTGATASALTPLPIPAATLQSLAFNPPSLLLAVGDVSAPLMPQPVPANASNQVSLSLSDATKAVVQPGNKVSALAEGTVLVTATSLFNASIKATLSLTIGPALHVKLAPKSILISKRSLALVPGGKVEELFAYVKPDSADQRVIWTSNHPEFAAITDGLVSPKAVGRAWIKAHAFGDASIADSIPVDVVVPTPFDSVRISRTSSKFYLNGTGQKIGFTTYPAGVPALLNWSSLDEGIIKIASDGSVTARSAGTTQVKAAAVGDPANSDSLQVRVVKDVPVLDAGPTQSVKVGDKVTFNIKVTQEFGGIKSLEWDFEGDGKFDGSATESPAKAEITYPSEKKEYLAVFKVVDGEGNTDSLTVRVRVGFETPLIIVKSPSRDTLVKDPAFTVAYSVDGADKTKAFTLVEGRNRLVVSETKASGSDSAIVFVTLDTKLPVVTILSPTAGTVTNKSVLKVDWKVDSVLQIQKTEEDISSKEGEITIVREALDDAGNKGQARVTVVRDITKPKIAFVSPKNGDTVTSSTITVTWTVDGETQKTQISENLTGADGEKTITRKGSDAAGNIDSLSIKVILNGTQPGAPKLSLDVPSPTNNNTPTWSWVSGGNGVGEFLFKLDDKELGAGSTTAKVLKFKAATLADGMHTLYIREKDAQGTWGPLASLGVEIDTKAPVVVIKSPIAGAKVSTATVAVEWTVDNVKQTKEVSETFATSSDGEKSIIRISTDDAGNIGKDTVKVVLDATQPGAPKITLSETSPTKVATPTWSWTSGGNGTGDYQYKLDNNDFTSGATDTRALLFKPINALVDGVHTLYVREKDAQGAWGPVGQSALEVDTKLPVVKITAPVAGAKITSSPVTVTWTVDGGAAQTNTEALTGADGEKTITRSGTDKAGNAGSTSVKVILDLLKPATPVYVTPSTPTSSTRSRKPTWTWKSGGGDAGGGFRYQLGSAAAVELPGTTFTPATDLADNTYTLKVAEKDAAGNWSPDASSTITIKGNAPAAPKLSVVAGVSKTPTWNWSGTTGATFGYKWKGNASFIKEGTATTYQPTAAEAGEGLRSLCVAEKDAIGYGAEACADIIVDRTNPAISLTGEYPADLMVTSVNPAFAGTASDANFVRVECIINDGSPTTVSEMAGAWSYTPSLEDGDLSVVFKVIDKANQSVSTTAVQVHKRSKVIFVRKGKSGDGTSWKDAYGNFGDALTKKLPSQSQVWVSAGTYEKLNSQEYVFSPNTSVIGGFNNTGGPLQNESDPAKYLTSVGPGSTEIGTEADPVDNLKISGFTFNAQNSNSGAQRIYISYSKGVVLEKCTFIKFSSDIPLLIRYQSNVTVNNCNFTGNYIGTYGAIMVGWGGFAEFNGGSISNNVSDDGTYAGGITIGWDASASMTSVTLSGNKRTENDPETGSPVEVPMNIHVISGGSLSHSKLTISGGSSTVSGDGTISPPF